jgi:acylphosphatase
MEHLTVKYHVEGRVQGVGFRRFVLHHANALGLTGYVANLDDGSVECVAQGESSALTELEMLLRQGPHYAEVGNVSCEDIESDVRRYTQFRIV